jgi:nicotinate-nucleotide pyrophosphorylase (carboxylating)
LIEVMARLALDEDCFGSSLATRGRPAHVPEDYRKADVTSSACVAAGARALARLMAKSRGVLAGLDLFAAVLRLTDPDVEIRRLLQDGDELEPGTTVATAAGSARALLVAERTGLNFVQRLSGVASATASYVSACSSLEGAAPARVRVLDTRKTTPLWRALEKYAVRCGGGENHRFGLFDQAMVKNNHADLAGRPLDQVVRDLRAGLGPAFRITCEARDEGEALGGAWGGADVILLDNFTPERLGALVPRLRAVARQRGRALELEASGGITLANAAAFAASGVERISVGALTHSAVALDLSLALEPSP